MEKKEQEKFVNDQVNLLYTNIEALFWDINYQSNNRIGIVFYHNIKKNCFYGYAGLIALIHFWMNEDYEEENLAPLIFFVQDKNVEIAKKLLIQQIECERDAILHTQNNQFISPRE